MGIRENQNITFFHYGVFTGVLLCLLLMLRHHDTPPPKADEKQIPHADFKPQFAKQGAS